MKNLKITNVAPFSLDSKNQAKLLKLVESISKHKKLSTGGGKEGFYALTLKLTNLIFNSNPEIGDVITDGVNFATVTGIDDNGDARLWEGVLIGDELQTRVETFNRGYLAYNYMVVGVISPADFKFDLNAFEVIKSNDVALKIVDSTKKYKKAKSVAKSDEALEVIAELDEFVEKLKSEKGLVETSMDEYKAEIQAKIDAQFGLTQNELDFISANFVRSEGSHGSWFTFHTWQLGKENTKITKSIAKKMSSPIDFNGLMFPASHLPNVKLISDVEVEEVITTTFPTIEELEERINDLPKGRGYANLGKKYKHSGARIEEFKIGKTKVEKGNKLFFKIGKTEVSGIFSHLNQCIHCPEGYVVVKFEGKNYERRQSRVSLTSAE